MNINGTHQTSKHLPIPVRQVVMVVLSFTLGMINPSNVFSQRANHRGVFVSQQMVDAGLAESSPNLTSASRSEFVPASTPGQRIGIVYRFSDQDPGAVDVSRYSIPPTEAGVLNYADCNSNCSHCESAATGITLKQGGSLDHGYAIMLPGLLGSIFCDKNVARSLRESEFRGAVEIYDWTRKPVMMGLNLGGDRCQAKLIASKIMDYQNRYPGRPVYLLGHSAGCKMAILGLESLPPDSQVERTFLLAPGLPTDYDLRPAMARTRSGLVAFTSFLDIPLPLPLAAVEGALKGQLNLAAAAFGFSPPAGLDPGEREYYNRMLVQKSFKLDMVFQGNLGGHTGATWPSFVTKHIAPLVNSPTFSTPDVQFDGNPLEPRLAPVHETELQPRESFVRQQPQNWNPQVRQFLNTSQSIRRDTASACDPTCLKY